MFRDSIACVVLLSGSVLFAQEGPKVVSMALSPAPKDARPLPYPLWPHLRDLKPGNGAVFYERSQSLEWWGASTRKQIDAIHESLERPWNPDTDKHAWLEGFGALKEIDYAARCGSCDWQLTDRLRTEGFWLLIPDMQAMRTLAVANAARIRTAIHQGEFDKAARGLQTGFVMSKNVGEAPTLITYLIGSAIAAMAQEQMEEWIRQPDAPSLFWSLTDLPSPMIDWRKPLQGEALVFDQVVPEIRQAMQEKKPHAIDPARIREGMRKYAEAGNVRFEPFEWSLLIVQAAEPAREHLAKRGLSAAEIDHLPVTQIVLMYLMSYFDERTDAMQRLESLPYWQARPFLNKLSAIQREDSDVLARRVAFGLMPSYERMFRIRPRIERRFAMLRCIEALRLHLAEHGQWPDVLEDLRPLPLPVDPYTGKAFTYRRVGDRAILEADAPPGQATDQTNAVRYELTIRKKASN